VQGFVHIQHAAKQYVAIPVAVNLICKWTPMYHNDTPMGGMALLKKRFPHMHSGCDAQHLKK
jgi:hypothetical protein